MKDKMSNKMSRENKMNEILKPNIAVAMLYDLMYIADSTNENSPVGMRVG